MTAPRGGPRLVALRRAVDATLADLPRGALVLVACSGGADSLALAAATAWSAERSATRALRDGGAILALRAGAVVVDHGLRPDAADVAQRAARRCAHLGLDPVRVAGVDVPGGAGGRGHGGPEAAARAARYGALEAAAAEFDAAAVLLGHTLDDQAETVLLALGRGAGASALAGMPPARGRLLRPLLATRRADTVAACAELGLDPDEDPSNAAEGPWRGADGTPLRRAALREGALPALAAALGTDPAPALARTAARVRADEDLLAHLAAELSARARRGGAEPGAGGAGVTDTARTAAASPGSAVVLDIATLRGAHPALLGRVLHAAALEAGAAAGALTHRHVDALAHLVRVRGRGDADLPGVTARRVEDGAEARLVLAPARPGTGRRCGTLDPTSQPGQPRPAVGDRTNGSSHGRHGPG